MNKKAQVNETLKLVGAVLMILLVIGVLVIAVFLSLDTITPVVTDTDSERSGNNSLNTALAISWNVSGYTFSDCNGYQGGKLNQVSVVLSNGTGYLTATNYTLSNCIITGSSGSYLNSPVNITGGNFTYLLTAQKAQDLQNNITTGGVNFFKQIPTIFTILGVVALIGAVVLIIVLVKRTAGGKGEVGL